MSLDLEQIVSPLQGLARQLIAKKTDAGQRLAKALGVASALGATELAALKPRIEASRGRVRWPAAGLSDALCQSYPLPPCPPNFTVVAVDGSHIEVDHHRTAQCYLINLGQVHLDYGEPPQASLSSQARLYWEEKDLFIADPQAHEEPVEGALLNARRSVEESQLLAQMAEELPGTQPALALLDGSLILWELGGQRYAPFVRQALLDRGLLPALDRLRAVVSRRPLAPASYISLPRSTEVVNALRLSLCPYEVPDCSQYCFTREATRECQAVAGPLDRELFETLLAPGERSPLFISSAPVVRNYYGEHQVAFFYLHAREEIARVEMPCWVADQPPLVALVHALTFDQCRRGLGYPVALSEAHQQAVVTAADRENFRRLVDRALAGEDLASQDSAKNRSKQTRWV